MALKKLKRLDEFKKSIKDEDWKVLYMRRPG